MIQRKWIRNPQNTKKDQRLKRKKIEETLKERKRNSQRKLILDYNSPSINQN
jgi:hypothetical protein